MHETADVEGLELQLELAGLDLGEVEHVIDELEQVQSSAVDVSRELAHVGSPVDAGSADPFAPPGEVSSNSENPMIACSGVRSSWLMAARKSLLAALACPSSALVELQLRNQRRPLREDLLAFHGPRRVGVEHVEQHQVVLDEQRRPRHEQQQDPLGAGVGRDRHAADPSRSRRADERHDRRARVVEAPPDGVEGSDAFQVRAVEVASDRRVAPPVAVRRDDVRAGLVGADRNGTGTRPGHLAGGLGQSLPQQRLLVAARVHHEVAKVVVGDRALPRPSQEARWHEREQEGEPGEEGQDLASDRSDRRLRTNGRLGRSGDADDQYQDRGAEQDRTSRRQDQPDPSRTGSSPALVKEVPSGGQVAEREVADGAEQEGGRRRRQTLHEHGVEPCARDRHEHEGEQADDHAGAFAEVLDEPEGQDRLGEERDGRRSRQPSRGVGPSRGLDASP